MTARLVEDIALLDRAMKIAGRAIWPEGDNVTVPAQTLATLAEELQRRRLAPAEYRLIDDEAVWLAQAAHRITLERADDNAVKVERWTRLAELLAAGVALDLQNACKSVEGVEHGGR